MNPLIVALTRAGLHVFGVRVLRVRGRRTGEWHETPVNVLELDGASYLVSARGDSEWVKNLRVAGSAELVSGHSIARVRAVELSDEDKPPVLRAYLARWKIEVGTFFGGVDDRSPDVELRGVAPGHPVFLIETISAA